MHSNGEDDDVGSTRPEKPTDRQSSRSSGRSRRDALRLGGAALAVATAGCTSRLSKLDPRGDGSASPDGNNSSPTGTDTGTGTPGQQSPTSWGPTIPTYPYKETQTPPLKAKPDPDVLNPVLTAGHVTDTDAQYVADPFLFVEDGTWHMFFEVYNGKGVLAHATSDDRGKTWKYDQLILERNFHISFPQVFKWKGEYFMSTAEQTTKSRLYKATKFPTEWEEAVLLFDATEFGVRDINDHALFQWNDKWWSLAGGPKGSTYAFYADAPDAMNWSAHEKNPVVKDRPTAARPGGRPIVRDDNVLVFFQDGKAYYGQKVRAYRITELSPKKYADKEVKASPVLEPAKSGWNSHRMHQYDPWYLGDGKGWRAAVDGDKSGNDWAIGIYRVPPSG